MDMEGRAKRQAGFPGDSFRFEVSPPKGSDCEVEWSGGGEPAAGSGPRFTTVFGSGGVYTVTARCGEASRQFQVTVCPVDDWLSAAKAYYGPSIDFTRGKGWSNRRESFLATTRTTSAAPKASSEPCVSRTSARRVRPRS